jgi:hypothetical protein
MARRNIFSLSCHVRRSACLSYCCVGPLLLVITVRLLAKVDQVRMAGRDTVHATARNYNHVPNPLYSRNLTSEVTSAMELSV